MRLDLDMLAALVKARALDLFARQIREVDGRALAVAVGARLNLLDAPVELRGAVDADHDGVERLHAATDRVPCGAARRARPQPEGEGVARLEHVERDRVLVPHVRREARRREHEVDGVLARVVRDGHGSTVTTVPAGTASGSVMVFAPSRSRTRAAVP